MRRGEDDARRRRAARGLLFLRRGEDDARRRRRAARGLLFPRGARVRRGEDARRLGDLRERLRLRGGMAGALP